ncbi:MAG: hypothetical protein WBN90_13225 [Gammaproteobacteria bacterium]
MQVVHKKISHWIWLALLTIIVLCSSVVAAAECQPAKTELVAGATDAADDDNRVSAREPRLAVNALRAFEPAGRLPAPDSDAYSSFILHGPPVLHRHV